MNRVIKFRAWDFKEMSYDVTGLEHGVENEMAGVFLDGDYYAISNFNGDVYNKTASIMQFTGLHDVNGVEIYEGDILRQEVNKHYWLYVVSGLDGFGSNLFACEYENNLSIDDELCIYTFSTQKVKLGSKRDFVNSEMKVIGNIYQNPELLESAK